MNYVREIPERDGIPFKYIIIDNDFSNLTLNKYSLMTMSITPAFNGNHLPLTEQKCIHLLLNLFLIMKKLNHL